jgi:SAM-dependent methyltransferase
VENAYRDKSSVSLPQVAAQHYLGAYDHKDRWLSYFYQIDLVKRSGAQSILEVGPGNGTVSAYLARQGMQMTTVDIDPALKPDFVASVVALPFDDARFDAVMACEVLEHLPFESFTMALTELARVSKRDILISLPDIRRTALYLAAKIPCLPGFSFRLRLMRRKEHHFDGEHYWEIGARGFNLRKVREAISAAGLECQDEFVATDAPFYHFFILRKSAAA